MQILHNPGQGGFFMQADITRVPFLPMGQEGSQGYEAHYQLSETY